VSSVRAAKGASGPAARSAGPPSGEVDVRRSSRRRRTVSAYRDGDRTVVLLPARMSRAEERHWVAVMLDRLAARERRKRPSDSELQARSKTLSDRYLAGRAAPLSVRWVSNQNGRWGSCSVDDRSIRLSDRLRVMPGYVVDYVLLHELAHLLVPGHGPAFWAELSAYPHTQRARGYLDGWSAASYAASDEGPDATPQAGVAGADDDPEADDEVGDGSGDEVDQSPGQPRHRRPSAAASDQGDQGQQGD
jgi:predicted metal-dependent hydrolase